MRIQSFGVGFFHIINDESRRISCAFSFTHPFSIRTETMILVASILISKGMAPGVMIASILGRAEASIPEVSLMGSIFKKKMVIAFVLCIFAVVIVTGYVFNFIL